MEWMAGIFWIGGILRDFDMLKVSGKIVGC